MINWIGKTSDEAIYAEYIYFIMLYFLGMILLYMCSNAVT